MNSFCDLIPRMRWRTSGAKVGKDWILGENGDATVQEIQIVQKIQTNPTHHPSRLKVIVRLTLANPYQILTR